ncbi:MAG: hypothetical protein WCA56_13095 [Xanthobacteraceae bacterium]|jgi:hypothetical protein
MKSLFTKSLVSSGLIAFSLALNGGAATAADLPAHKAAATAHVARPRPAVRVAARQRKPAAQPYFDIGQFIQGMLGGPLPPQYARIVQNATRGSASHRSSGSDESWDTYDYSTPSPTVDVDNSQSQAAIDASDQAIQQLDQSIQDMDASNAAAQAQNDAANAATLQTEINAGM